ncbi:MAG: UDP-2,3-diacylglucosamine diphosphatase LpxI [Verrucomicrobia bacterium]|nr:UDP-2,3-diacylglucosamine diphosphatase LpxI [Verrucomicrobiota bacterium]
MEGPIPESLGIIAGRGAYPRLLAEASRREGVRRLFAVAFRWETDPAIARVVDEVAWIRLGQLGAMLDAFRRSAVRQAVMAGQIKPTHLFSLRMDRAMMNLLAGLRERNAHTIFGAVGEELKKNGVELLPAHLFMESAMPAPGLLGRRPPTDREQADIELGLKVAKMTSGLEIGQTVVIKNGTILSVEAFEGTDAAIRRAGKLGGPGAVVVKVAKRGHDMRFDIPVVGLHTFRSLRRIKASALAVEARRTILLEREKIIAQADRQGLCLVSVSLDEAKT